jgi:fatty acid desaturase
MVMRYTVPRLAHLEHHRMVGREGDPYRYFWNFGADERKAFLAQVLSIATGLVFVRTLLGTVAGLPNAADGAEGAGSVRRRPPSPHEMPNAVQEPRELIHIAATHVCILAAFTLSIGWIWYFVLWLMPAVTLGSATDFIRNWAEHRHGDLIIYRPSSLERLLFAPLNFNMHAVHHVFPAEPWFRLPALEQRARDDTPGIRECQSYLGEVFRYLKGADTETDHSTADGTTPANDG